MNYYRRYVGDMQADTMALSCMEQGVYDRLLDHMYATERPIPWNSDRAALICRAITLEEKAAVQYILDTYFDHAPDGWRHKRVEKEIAISHQRSKAGKEGADARWGSEPDAKTDGKTDAKAHAEDVQKKCPPITNHQPPLPTTSNQDQPPAVTPLAGKKRPPADYTPEFETAWKLYPPRSGDNPKRQALQAWNARGKTGVSAADMIAGVNRYRAFIESQGKIGTEFVMQARRFFGPDEPFRNTWHAPVKVTLEERNQRAIEAWEPPSPQNLETEDGTFRWWADEQQILVHGSGQDVNPRDNEDFADYTARVFAALGPGPWIDEADDDMRARVVRAQRGEIRDPSSKPEPIRRRG